MRRVAFLVGNSTFSPESGLSQLRFPPDDVKSLEGVLLDPKIGRYDKVASLVNNTCQKILKEYNTFLREERGAEILFYYSGHGKPSDQRKLFLAAHDTSQDDLLISGIPFSTIIELKENYGVRTFTAILDCCFAGLGSPDVKGSEADELKAMGSGRGVFFLGAANSTEIAKENEELRHGVLTSAILEGLNTGLADRDNDGQVSGNDLFSWCADYAQRRGAQRVVMTGQAESRDVIVAYSRRRIAAEVIERLRANIATAYTQEWLPQQELDKLRDYYLVPTIVVVPPAGSLADRFLAYTERRITLRELFGPVAEPIPTPPSPSPPPPSPPSSAEQKGPESRASVSPPSLGIRTKENAGSQRLRIYLQGVLAALSPIVLWLIFLLYLGAFNNAMARQSSTKLLLLYLFTSAIYGWITAELWFRFHDKKFLLTAWVVFLFVSIVLLFGFFELPILGVLVFALCSTASSGASCVFSLVRFDSKRDSRPVITLPH